MERSILQSFLDVVHGGTEEIATWFLQATNWRLDLAIELYYDHGGLLPHIPSPPYIEEPEYADMASNSDQGGSERGLAALFRPPFEILFYGSFEEAKTEAGLHGRWLLVNLQSRGDVASHTLNRDTWSNDAVQDIIRTNFVFLQVYEDALEGRKLCTIYKLDSLPSTLLIDPITGQKLRSWLGMVNPDTLLPVLAPYLRRDPRDCFKKVQTSRAQPIDGAEEHPTSRRPAYPPLPEEPVEGDGGLLCRVAVRLPDGRRVQRRFLRSDPVLLLWSLCDSLLEEEDRRFQLKLTKPGTSPVVLHSGSGLSLEEAGVCGCLVTAVWE